MPTIWKRLWASIFDPEIDEDFLKNYYASMPIRQLKRLDPKNLTPLARPLWYAEVKRRENESASLHKLRKTA